MSAKEVEERIKSNQMIHLIDVRTKEEIKKGMIPAAVSIPLNTLPDQLDKLDKGKEYIMVCRSGSRSGKAVKLLQKEGFQAVNMKGGMFSWRGPVSK